MNSNCIVVKDPIYSYTTRGRLIYDKHEFVKNLVIGHENIIYWRCVKYRNLQCPASIKTVGKTMYVSLEKHVHDVAPYVTAVQATLWQPDEDDLLT